MPAEIHALPMHLADCLKMCYVLRERGEPITAAGVRTLLAATRPTGPLSGGALTHAFRQLQKRGYVSYTRYHGATLTQAGAAMAAELVRHHRLLELLLVRVLDMPLDQVTAEADQLEHALSERLEEHIDALLGHPTEDPHGDPIPDTMGRVHLPASFQLREALVGQHLMIQRITTRDKALVQYLERLHLVPGTVIFLADQTAYADVLTLHLNSTVISVSTALAQHVLVKRIGKDS